MAALTTRTFSTPNPEELSFGVLVGHDRVLQYKLKPPGTVYKSYGDLIKPAPRVADGYGDYLYTGTQDAEDGLWLLFAKPKTAAEALTPFRRYTKKFGNHYWHPILVDVVIVADVGRVIATPGPNGTTRYEYPHVMRKIYIPPVSEGTRFIMEEGVSPTPIVIPQKRVPMPGNVSFDFGDVHGDFPECLHGRSLRSTTRTRSRAGRMRRSRGRRSRKRTSRRGGSMCWTGTRSTATGSGTGGRSL
jgi:hypothetical protein